MNVYKNRLFMRKLMTFRKFICNECATYAAAPAPERPVFIGGKIVQALFSG